MEKVVYCSTATSLDVSSNILFYFFCRPSGIRLGTPALTTRGLGLKDMDRVADFIHAGVQLTMEIAKLAPTATLKDFKVSMTLGSCITLRVRFRLKFA